MDIHAIFERAAFDSEVTTAMGVAYDKLAAKMRLTRQDDPLTRRLAETIIEVATTGQRDPDKMCEGVVALLKNGKS